MIRGTLLFICGMAAGVFFLTAPAEAASTWQHAERAQKFYDKVMLDCSQQLFDLESGKFDLDAKALDDLTECMNEEGIMVTPQMIFSHKPVEMRPSLFKKVKRKTSKSKKRKREYRNENSVLNDGNQGVLNEYKEKAADNSVLNKGEKKAGKSKRNAPIFIPSQ